MIFLLFIITFSLDYYFVCLYCLYPLLFPFFYLEEAELVSLRTQLPTSPEYLYGARLRPSSDFSLYTEIDNTWVLRDNDFNFIWPSPEAIYSTGMGDIYSSILAMRSKASRIFLSPRQFLMDRKKEGAQEYLGDILY